MNHEFFTGYNAELKDRSRQLRKNMTRQEGISGMIFCGIIRSKSIVSAALTGSLPIFIAAARIL